MARFRTVGGAGALRELKALYVVVSYMCKLPCMSCVIGDSDDEVLNFCTKPEERRKPRQEAWLGKRSVAWQTKLENKQLLLSTESVHTGRPCAVPDSGKELTSSWRRFVRRKGGKPMRGQRFH